MAFTSSTVSTYNASGTLVIGIASSSVALISLVDTYLPTLLGSASQANLTVKITMSTAHVSFMRQFTIKF
jgi:hypothetical protein